jgi:deoxyadenosine/deoxycytidine kinase
VNKLQENIKKRNRSYELNIKDDYLFEIQQTYTHYIKQHSFKTLFVDASNVDFLNNQEHFDILLDALNRDYTEGQHVITFP